MAAPVEDLQSEVSCSVCLEYFTDPVTIECGHSYCRACITQSWGTAGGILTCPQCRKVCTRTDLYRNVQLSNLVEITQKFSSRVEDSGDMCTPHNEKLKLFCEEDQSVICTICDKSRVHRGHSVIPIEEAAEQYQFEFNKKLKCLQKEMADILSLEANEKQRLAEFKKKVDKERKRIEDECKEFYSFLEELKCRYLCRLDEEEKNNLQKLNTTINSLSEQSSSLNKLINQIEERRKLSSVQQLKDVKHFLSRCESQKGKKPDFVSTEMSDSVCSFSLQQVLTKAHEKYGGKQAHTRRNEPETHAMNIKMSAQRSHGGSRNNEPVTRPRVTATLGHPDSSDASSSCPELEELRIILLDLTGARKSDTANRILGRKESDCHEAHLVETRTCKRGSCEWNGTRIVVIDTPLLDREVSSSKERITAEMIKCMCLSSPGPHAIVLMLHVGQCIREVEETITEIQTLFDNAGERHMIVLFTEKDILGNKTIDCYVQESEAQLKDLIAKCGNRYCAFSNGARGEEREGQVCELITFIDCIDSILHDTGGACYTDDAYARIEKPFLKAMELIKVQYSEEWEAEEDELKCQFAEIIEDLKVERDSTEKTRLLEEMKREGNRKLEESEQNHGSKLRGAKDGIVSGIMAMVLKTWEEEQLENK